MEGGALKNLRNPSIGPIGSALPSWKLYDNPFYYHHHHHHQHQHHHHPGFHAQHHPYNHANRLPLSARKLAASLWDLATLFHPMDPCAGDAAACSELHLARARIRQLKAELEFERRLRRKAEALSRALAREASEERARREAEEREREKLAAEVDELRRAVEEERRMMRVAEALREERVQMKLAEARLLMEERLLQMGMSSSPATRSRLEDEAGEISSRSEAIHADSEELCPNSASDGSGRSGSDAVFGGGPSPQRKEAENPHIRRGIKGFVEFPKVGRTRAG